MVRGREGQGNAQAFSPCLGLASSWYDAKPMATIAPPSVPDFVLPSTDEEGFVELETKLLGINLDHVRNNLWELGALDEKFASVHEIRYQSLKRKKQKYKPRLRHIRTETASIIELVLKKPEPSIHGGIKVRTEYETVVQEQATEDDFWGIHEELLAGDCRMKDQLQSHRETFFYNGVCFEIDTLRSYGKKRLEEVFVPPFLEIEANCVEDIYTGIEKIGYSQGDMWDGTKRDVLRRNGYT